MTVAHDERQEPGKLVCPSCGEVDSPDVRLDLNSQDGVMVCQTCNAEWNVEHIRRLCAAWVPALAWLDARPVCIKPAATPAAE